MSEKQGMGCMAKGCLILFLCILVIGGLTIWKSVQIVKSFTSTTTIPLPGPEPAPDQYASAKQRVEEFGNTIKLGQPAQLELTDTDINAFIAHDPGFKEIKGMAYVKVNNGQISADASIPLDKIPGFSGRYLNGKIAFKLSIENGVAFLYPENIEANGKPVPADFMNALKKENFAEKVNENPQHKDLLKKVQSLEVTDRITIKTLGANGQTWTPPAPAISKPKPQATLPQGTVKTSSQDIEITGTASSWLTDFAQAQTAAQSKGVPILADFTGSDWCSWCIKLDNEVFEKDQFKSYAAKNLVLLKLDFPQRKPIAPALLEQNQNLAKKYGIRGYPTILILDASGTELAKLGYMPGGPSAFISELDKTVKTYNPTSSKTTPPAKTTVTTPSPQRATPPPARNSAPGFNSKEPLPGNITIEGYEQAPE